MSNDRDFSDEELTAFLDGEFEHVRVRELRQAMKNDPDLQVRFDTLNVNKSEINAAFDTLLEKAPVMPVMPEAGLRKAFVPRAKNLVLIAAFSLVFLLAGLSGGYFMGQQTDKNWREFVATYHALYINATLSDIQQTADDAGGELGLVSKNIGKKIDLSVLVQQDQLDYKRAQILGFEGRPLLQLTFLSKLGDPIALCIIRSSRQGDGQKNSKITMSEMRGMQAASWSQGGYEYFLIGGRDSALIKNAANEFSKNL